ncbi:MAG: class I mannose-6-phosphate isomerase [Butyrivibrio sp.]|nr:class I mannose-6-phosphate isomerase [Butyrivibrio sp.]
MDKIIFLKPAFSHTVWGGTRIRTDFGYDEPGEDIGECWGISAHPAGDSVITNGMFSGKTLSQMYADCPEFFGNCPQEEFPLLTKIIDARDNLSIQVHPDDEYAAIHENGASGKTECWYIIDCPQNAELIVGHNAKSKDELKSMISEGKWEKLIRRVPVKKGDFIQIDAGTVHAITAGCLILETQQNSNITYRLYDYDRKPLRELHLSQSIDTIRVPARDAADCIFDTTGKKEFVYSNDFYEVGIMRISGNAKLPEIRYFMNLSIVAGEGLVNGNRVHKGDHIIIAGGSRVILNGNMEIVRSTFNA